MSNKSVKDNFYLKTRLALQDSMTLYYIVKNIGQNNSVEFYLPRLIELLSDLIEVERCGLYLYDRLKDELYCKVITGRIKEQISFPRASKENIIC